MNRPAFQYYPADWRSNAKLRRCSWAARGVWVEVLGLMHDSDEYGILRWPLKEIAAGVGCQPQMVRELVDKLVMKGDDKRLATAYAYAPSHAGRRGAEIVLVPIQDGPIWFSSRMVRDEYNRLTRGNGTRFGDPPNPTPNPTPIPTPIPPFGEAPKGTPKVPPKGAPIPPFGDGASSSNFELQKSEVGVTPPIDARAQGGDSKVNVATEKTENSTAKVNGAGQRWQSPSYVAATAGTLGISRRQGEDDTDFRDRVYAAIQHRITKAKQAAAGGSP